MPLMRHALSLVLILSLNPNVSAQAAKKPVMSQAKSGSVAEYEPSHQALLRHLGQALSHAEDAGRHEKARQFSQARARLKQAMDDLRIAAYTSPEPRLLEKQGVVHQMFQRLDKSYQPAPAPKVEDKQAKVEKQTAKPKPVNRVALYMEAIAGLKKLSAEAKK